MVDLAGPGPAGQHEEVVASNNQDLPSNSGAKRSTNRVSRHANHPDHMLERSRAWLGTDVSLHDFRVG